MFLWFIWTKSYSLYLFVSGFLASLWGSSTLCILYNCISFYPYSIEYFLYGMHLFIFILSTVAVHMENFQDWAIINIAAMKILKHVFWWAHVPISSGRYIPRRRICLCLILADTIQQFISLHSHQEYMRVSAAT